MPKPGERTRSRKRVSMSLPGGGRTTHYKQGVTGNRYCDICKKPLAGIQHVSVSRLGKLNRSKRRLSRPYGNEICPKCLKNSLKNTARTL